jgi:hypothetical protein
MIGLQRDTERVPRGLRDVCALIVGAAGLLSELTNSSADVAPYPLKGGLRTLR